MGHGREDHDPIPRGRTRTAQAITVALLILGLLTAIFVLQNTARTSVTFLFWSASVPLAGALLLAAVLGGILAFLMAFLRQRLFRRAIKREHRARDVAEASGGGEGGGGPSHDSSTDRPPKEMS
jgi:uncharacterized integral membrane protein